MHMALNLKNKYITNTKRKNKQKGTPNHFAFDLLRSLVSGKFKKKKKKHLKCSIFLLFDQPSDGVKPKMCENGGICFFAMGSVVLFVY